MTQSVSVPSADQATKIEPRLRQRKKPNGKVDPAGEAGWYLEREREGRGVTLSVASSATGIHPYHIEAIELGDMARMPPRIEALEMVAAYARYLGFDPEPLLEHYVSFVPQPELAPRHHPAAPAPMSSAKIMMFGKFPKLPPINIQLPTIPGGRNGMIASIAGSLLLVGAVGWSLSPGDVGVAPTGQIAQMPEATTGADAAHVKVTESPIVPIDEDVAAAPAAVEGEPQLDLQNADALGAFINEQLEGMADPVTTASTTPVDATPNGRSFGSADPKSRVVLRAVKPIWLLIEDGRGNRVATQLLNIGDEYRVPNQAGLVAIAQDGGALAYSVDGTDKGLLGVPGTLLAAEPLDSTKLAAKG